MNGVCIRPGGGEGETGGLTGKARPPPLTVSIPAPITMAPTAPTIKQHGHIQTKQKLHRFLVGLQNFQNNAPRSLEPSGGNKPPQIRHVCQSRLIESSCNLYPQIAEYMESLHYNYRHLNTHSASSNMSTILKLTQSLCADCGGCLFRGAAPTSRSEEKMAASMRRAVRVLCRLSSSVQLPSRQYQTCLQRSSVSVTGRPVVCDVQRRFYTEGSLQDDEAAQVSEFLSRYKDHPWEYLDSEEYTERYGSNPVWMGYRRNHKGGIPPQKTRKTCIRGDKICGNPCPICRDPNIFVHHQNVKLLQQFISPHTGQVYDPTRTSVCMKQHKKLNQAIDMAKDHGLLPFQIPHAKFSEEDYSNCHDAVGTTPPPPASGVGWYTWYDVITPNESEVLKVRKTYKAYLKRRSDEGE